MDIDCGEPISNNSTKMEASLGKFQIMYTTPQVNLDGGEPSEPIKASRDNLTSNKLTAIAESYSIKSFDQTNAAMKVYYNPFEPYIVPISNSGHLTVPFEPVVSDDQKMQFITLANMESAFQCNLNGIENSGSTLNQTEASENIEAASISSSMEGNPLAYSMTFANENGQTVVKVVYDSLGTSSTPAKESEFLTPAPQLGHSSVEHEEQQHSTKAEDTKLQKTLNTNGGGPSNRFQDHKKSCKGKPKPTKKPIHATQSKLAKKSTVKPKTSFEIMCEQFLNSANKSHMLKKE